MPSAPNRRTSVPVHLRVKNHGQPVPPKQFIPRKSPQSQNPADISLSGTSDILATERHFTPTQLAALWSMSPSKVRELFAKEEGVIRFGEPSRREGKKLVRSYYSMRIPESVAGRVHDSLTSIARRPAKRVQGPDRAPRERSVA
jgi:hypothetical protein